MGGGLFVDDTGGERAGLGVGVGEGGFEDGRVVGIGEVGVFEFDVFFDHLGEAGSGDEGVF